MTPRPWRVITRPGRGCVGICVVAAPVPWSGEEEAGYDHLSLDVVVFDAGVPLTTRPVSGSAVLLAVEVVSRGSRREDRGAKPLAYAEAGIRHYWRVEGPASGATALAVHTYELDGSGEYKATGVYDHTLTVDLPGTVRIDLLSLS
ncbi:Uma2 family endonuclease [Kutzneria sp. CA-103260]|uniref:Uma2 family endonuclease n=1 Tax=Kutzneria sp. CA-103260 TaxID=2802641 RepID=UPI0020133837|nr:Uma2 family endonuclease [Kutzneria sp. CA-103260]